MNNYEDDLIPKICPVCKCEFYPAPMHAWKEIYGGKKKVCSYSCSRKSEQKEYIANCKKCN